VNRADFVHDQRREAWTAGRSLADCLIRKYMEKYHLPAPPPPAQVIDELLTDVLRCRLEHAPLPLGVFAETTWTDSETIVTVNNRTSEIPGVKDAKGVQNVAKWHECVHVTRDEPARGGSQGHFPGLEPTRRFICSRGEQPDKSPAHAAREFFAEEAGRAAAVSLEHLWRSEAFLRLVRFAGKISNGSAWTCLYQAAADIHVNISALVTQLELEGLIVVEKRDGKSLLYVQPSLVNLAGLAA
jgi:hypothetical protein